MSFQVSAWCAKHNSGALALLERVLGPGRFARSSYRARELHGATLQAAFVCVAGDGEVIGCVQAYSIWAKMARGNGDDDSTSDCPPTTADNNINISALGASDSLGSEAASASTTASAKANAAAAMLGWLVGPLAVDAAHRGLGSGKALIAEVRAAARHTPPQSRPKFLTLVGDMPYYQQLGFSINNRLLLPQLAPTEASRVLVLPLAAASAGCGYS